MEEELRRLRRENRELKLNLPPKVGLGVILPG